MSPQAKSNQATPCFDHVQFLQRVNQDEDHIRHLIELFLELSQGNLLDISNAVQQRESSAIRDTAHRFKGALRFIHANQAATAAQCLEELAMDGDGDRIQAAHETLVEAAQRLVRELNAYLREARANEQARPRR